jgi:hypothetical protein
MVMPVMKKILLCAFLCVLASACEQPFQSGLGKKVDIVPPKFTSGISPAPGSYLSGVVTFSGTVWDDMEVVRVEVLLENNKWRNAALDKSAGKFTFNLDTTDPQYGDGPLSIVFRVTDNSGKSAETSVLSYTVKNLPPQVEMTIPTIKGDDFDRPDLKTRLENMPVYQGFDLMGLAADAQGIRQGYPQIMLWPANYANVDSRGIPFESDRQYGVWRSLVVPRDEDGLKATQFSWPMVNLVADGAGGFRLPAENEPSAYLGPGAYRFRIRTLDMGGVENYYPNRLNNTKGLDPADPRLNQYIEIQYAAAEIPIIIVRDIPGYYNGVGDLTVTLNVNCKNPVDWVRAQVTEDVNAPNLVNPPYFSAVQTGSSGTVYNYKLTIPAAAAATWAQGNKMLHLGAASNDGKTSPPLYRNFIFDTDPPEVFFDRPVLGTEKLRGKLPNGRYAIYWSGWVTGQITIGGISKDGYGIEKLYYHIGRLDDDNAADDAAREAIYNAADWTDTALDTNTPALKWSGSLYAWNYTGNFNDNLPGSGLGDYKQFHRNMIEDDVDLSTPTGKTSGAKRFYLPFYVKAVDHAGNQRVVQYKLYIDPDADIPQAAFSTLNDGDKVGGEVRVSGTAWDNNWIHSVQIRITDLDKPPTDPDYYYRPQGSPGVFIPGGSTNPNDEPGWLPAKIAGNTGKTVAWFYTINSDGRLTPSGNAPRKVKIEVRAVDVETGQIDHTVPHLVGYSAVRNIEFDAGVPTISIPKIIKAGAAVRDYNEGIRVSGKFKLTAVAGDDGGITAVRARISGQSAFTDLITGGVVQGGLPSGWTAAAPALQSNGRYESALSFEIDSTVIPNMGYGKGGFFTLELQVFDNNAVPAPYQTNGTYTLGVDNFYPSAEITTRYNAATENFYVSGTAKDRDNQSGSVQGLERVLVYFEKNGVFYNARCKSPGDTDTFYQTPPGSAHSGEWATIPPMISYQNVKDMTQAAVPGKPYEPNLAVMQNFPLLKLRSKGGNTGDVWESPHAMVIDAQELGEAVDSDEDGTFAEMWEGRVDKEWQARLNTTLFPDGPYKVHYIVMDQAGNAAHYAGDIYIGNRKPLIREFNLGTDIDGSGAITPWTNSASPGEYMRNPWAVGTANTGEISANVTVRNYRFGITIDALYGNGIKHYKVSYVTRNQTPVDSAAMIRGAVYTIKDQGTTDWAKYGAPNNNTGTTFVASGPAKTGTGAAWKYDYAAGAEKSGDMAGNSANILFDANDFKSIPDTIDNTNPGGNPDKMARFIIKVYDSTVAGGSESDQLAHAALVRVDIDNIDETPPAISYAPFGKKYALRPASGLTDYPTLANDADKILSDVASYTENIVSSGGAKQGYVQYAAHRGTAGNACLSGKAIFLGKAADNQRISRITAVIANYNGGNEFTIAQWEAAAGKLVPLGGHTLADVASGAAEWGFGETDQYLTLDYGHALNWQFAWDSSKVDGAVRNNVDLRFKVYDTRLPAANNAAAAAAVDIVPYISEVVTRLSSAYAARPSAFNRSALGWYPVREDETIQIKGFNFRSGSTVVTVDGVTLNGVNVVSANRVDARIDDDGIAANANAIKSGELVVTVNGIPSINNSNNNAAAYNQEPNGLNNNILTDDRYLYVWNTGALINQTNMTSPFMRMDNSSNIYISLGNGNMSMSFWKNNAFLSTLEQCYNKYHNTTVAFDSSGNMYGGATNTDRVNDTVGGATSFTFYSRTQGSSAMGTSGNYNTGTNRRHLELSYNGATGVYDINRVKIPRIAVRGAGTANDPAKIYLSYYDGNSLTNQVKFRYGTVGAYADNISGDISSNIFYNNPGTGGTFQTVADNTAASAYKSGMYTAVGALSTGRAVIAWYDAANQRLVFSYSRTTDPSAVTTLAQWQANARVIDPGIAGWHVDMAVDGRDGIHIAYYTNGNGGLRYAYLSSYTAAPVVVNVDTYLSAGTKLMINTRAETRNAQTVYVPYISYYHASFPSTMNSLRVAWRNDWANPAVPPAGTDSGDCFTGKWEVMTVPANNIPAEDFVCNGVPGAGSYTFNYISGGAVGSSTVNLTNTVLLGYFTNAWYERAYIKK